MSNENEIFEFMVFSGTRMDVFNSMETLCHDFGYPMFDRNRQVVDLDTIETRHDIKPGHFISFVTPGNFEICLVGYNVDDIPESEKIFQQGIGMFSDVLSLKSGMEVEVHLHKLEDEGNRESYEKFIEDMASNLKRIKISFEELYLAELSKEDFYRVYEMSENKLVHSHNDVTYETVGKTYKLDSIDDVEPGMVIPGTCEIKGLKVPSVALIGYKVDREKVATMSLGLMAFLYTINEPYDIPKVVDVDIRTLISENNLVLM